MNKISNNDQISVTTAAGIEVLQTVAGVGGRSYAFIIDWHIRLLIVLVWILTAIVLYDMGFTGDIFKHLLGDDSQPTMIFYIAFLPPLLIYLFYHPVLEILMAGRTPGKRIAGIRIIAKNGLDASVGAILIRNIFRIIDSLPAYYILGLTVAFINRHNCRIGDIAAGTVLVYEDKTSVKDIQWLNQVDAKIMSAQQYEIAVELLDRWGSLERDVRIQLAHDLLHKLGDTIPTASSPGKLDKAIKNHLKQLTLKNK